MSVASGSPPRLGPEDTVTRPPGPPRGRWVASGVVCVGLYLLGLDMTVLNVAAPPLQEDLSASTAQVQWVVNGYSLMLGGLVLTTGSVTDRIGRRRAFVSGVAACGAASVVGATASTVAVVIAARFAMGAGAALLMPATLSVITNLFPEPDLRRRAIALWAAVGAAGAATGPLLGGCLVEFLSWRAAFWVNVPLAAAGIALALRYVPESYALRGERFDAVGALLSGLGFLGLVWAVIEGPTRGWGSRAVVAGFVGAGLLLAVFAAHQVRARAPMLPLPLLRRPAIGVAAAVLALLCFALLGTFFIGTLYLQNVLGCSPWQAGVRTLPVPVALAVGAGAAVPLTTRYGVRVPTVTGLAVVTAGFAVLAGATATGGYPRVFVFEVAAGFGAGLAVAACTESVMAAVPSERAGLGSAINDATRQVGAAVGVAVQGSILSAVYADRLPSLLARTPAAALAATGGGHDPLAARDAVTAAPGPVRALYLAGARRAFVDGMTTAALVAGAVTAILAVVAVLALPARPAAAAAPQPPTD
ncbi:MFS transporter [Yinghuangia sp. ASG 101]|uniref:MFS transporter n=1 Tax=Yinghuangia sp. ASG 101 TaxID=2896848 RepID=UPI001E619E90|nr:MFS transporter [Yinghuangia sp. ASG 101]UGQ11899.1 MFS transporter [Yinghuangia sp. ASG 101]